MCCSITYLQFCYFCYPRLWNELPEELRQSVDDESLSLSSHLSLTSSSSSSSAPLSLCITPSLFYFRLKTYLSINPPHHSLYFFRRISWIFMTISGLICSVVFVLFFSFHFLFDSYDRLCWFNPLWNCMLNNRNLLFFPFHIVCNSYNFTISPKPAMQAAQQAWASTGLRRRITPTISNGTQLT